MGRRVLYLGLDPISWPVEVVHYPVIRTERCEVSLEKWDACTHVIFTSRRAVQYWEEPFGDRVVIAIGEATAGELRRRGKAPLVAGEATQEGICALLDGIDCGYIFLPRSKRARNVLPEYLARRGIPHRILDLYDTALQRPEPVPDLAEFDEIVFTSPSTVDGFLQIFGTFPEHCALTAIGPITKSKIFSS